MSPAATTSTADAPVADTFSKTVTVARMLLFIDVSFHDPALEKKENVQAGSDDLSRSE